ncbi:MAG: Nif11 family protein [Solobacterium sp.]|nr:Nif11 family protein [Solobacterium sp.]
MKELDISEALKDWLTPKDLASLDKLVKYLEELGEKAKNIKTMDDAYDFAKNDLGMKCTKKEFNEGAKYLEYIGDQIKKETAKAEDQAKNAYLDAVAVYMTAEKQLSEAQGEYAKYSKKLEAEIKANRKLAPKYIEKAAKEREKETKKFNEEVKKVLESKDAKQFLDYVKNFEDLGKKFSKAKNTKEAYKLASKLGLDCSWDEFKEYAKQLGIYKG